MHSKLDTTENTAQQMPLRFGDQSATVLRGTVLPVWMSLLRTRFLEVSSPPSEAHILALLMTPVEKHYQWHDGKLVFEGAIPAGRANIVRSGITLRAVTPESDVLHVYIPHSVIEDRAVEMGYSSARGSLHILDPCFREDTVLQQALLCLASYLRENSSMDSLLRDTLTDALVTRIIERWSNVVELSRRPLRGCLANWQLRKVCDAMQSQLDVDWSLKDLADMAGCSSTHFSRAFKNSIGVAPFLWLKERRIQRAKELLENSSLSLAEIALEIGYSGQPQFTTAFKSITQETPGQWRRTKK